MTLDELFDLKFHHDAQVSFCARHLALLRSDLGDSWWKFGEHKASHAGKCTDCWTREHVDLASYLIRHASESVNHPATVDFVTKKALAYIRAAKAKHTPRHRGISHLQQWELFTHEHMVPGSAALRILTNPAVAAKPLKELLGTLSFRALITGTSKKRQKGVPNGELGSLDARFKSRLPDPDEVLGWPRSYSLEQIPTKFYGLLRYEATGLIDELVPVSPRVQGLVEEYRSYKALLAR
jgi:hypothetical protein